MYFSLKKFKSEENLIENIEHINIDPMICSDKFGISNPSVVSQEKLEDIKELVKAADKRCRMTFRGNIKDITRANYGVITGKYTYECRIIVSDVQIQE